MKKSKIQTNASIQQQENDENIPPTENQQQIVAPIQIDSSTHQQENVEIIPPNIDQQHNAASIQIDSSDDEDNSVQFVGGAEISKTVLKMIQLNKKMDAITARNRNLISQNQKLAIHVRALQSHVMDNGENYGAHAVETIEISDDENVQESEQQQNEEEEVQNTENDERNTENDDVINNSLQISVDSATLEMMVAEMCDNNQQAIVAEGLLEYFRS